MNANSPVKNDMIHIEREALKLFLESVKKELNAEFSFFSASVDYSAKVPQLSIQENGKI